MQKKKKKQNGLPRLFHTVPLPSFKTSMQNSCTFETGGRGKILIGQNPSRDKTSETRLEPWRREMHTSLTPLL